METVGTTMAMLVVAMAAIVGCSKNTVVEPEPATSEEIELHYSAHYTNSEGNFAVKRLEFADETGTVREVREPLPRWSRTLTLKPGDRVYVRAEIEYESVFWAAVQVSSAAGVLGLSEVERLDGPNTCVLEIDRLLE